MIRKMFESSYIPLIAAILIGIIAAWTAFYQIKKEKKESDDKNKEFGEVIERNNRILTDTKNLLDNTQDLLKKADCTLLAQQDIQIKQIETLKNLRLQLNNTENIIFSQNEILKKQLSTLKNLQGTDKAPVLTVSVNSIMESPTEYLVVISLTNNDEYPCRSVEVTIMEDPAKNYPIRMRGRKTDDEINLEDFDKFAQNKPFGKFEIAGNSSQLITSLKRKFNDLDNRTNFAFVVKWARGSYSLSGALTINDFKPSFLDHSLIYTDKSIYLNNLSHFEFKTDIDEFSRLRIKKNKLHKQQQEQQRRELKN